jgi:hypothetical protein
VTKAEPNATKPAGLLASRRGAPSALRPRLWPGTALIVLITSFAYVPALSGGFILDDDVYLTANKLIKAPDALSKFWFTTEPLDYYPVSNTTLWLKWRLWGMQSIGYHVTNLVLHIVEALLVWMILRRLSIPGAFLGALLFAVHPVNVESVAWIAQRKELLATLLFLLSILWYLQAEADGRADAPRSQPIAHRAYALSLTAFLLGTLSKGRRHLAAAFIDHRLVEAAAEQARSRAHRTVLCRRRRAGSSEYVVSSAHHRRLDRDWQLHPAPARRRSRGLVLLK